VNTTCLLAVDVGGTNTRLALYERRELPPTSEPHCLCMHDATSDSAPSLTEIAQRFLKDHAADREVVAACFGVPGPVQFGSVQLTNLPWRINEAELAAGLIIPRVRLVNDHVATAAALPLLRDQDLFVLHPGHEARERRTFAILAPGTGLGQACLHIDSVGRPHPMATEGGHVEFAPTCEIQVALLNYLRRKYEHRVSVERILSGPGIVNIHDFLRDSGRWDEPSALREELDAAEQPAAVISDHGLKGNHAICVRTMDIFAAILGSHAGDLVLNYLATGGIFLGGGIPPRIATHLRGSCLVDTYRDKGRLSPLVDTTPLAIIMHRYPALLGAAVIAGEMA